MKKKDTRQAIKYIVQVLCSPWLPYWYTIVLCIANYLKLHKVLFNKHPCFFLYIAQFVCYKVDQININFTRGCNCSIKLVINVVSFIFHDMGHVEEFIKLYFFDLIS